MCHFKRLSKDVDLLINAIKCDAGKPLNNGLRNHVYTALKQFTAVFCYADGKYGNGSKFQNSCVKFFKFSNCGLKKNTPWFALPFELNSHDIFIYSFTGASCVSINVLSNDFAAVLTNQIIANPPGTAP